MDRRGQAIENFSRLEASVDYQLSVDHLYRSDKLLLFRFYAFASLDFSLYKLECKISPRTDLQESSAFNFVNSSENDLNCQRWLKFRNHCPRAIYKKGY